MVDLIKNIKSFMKTFPSLDELNDFSNLYAASEIDRRILLIFAIRQEIPFHLFQTYRTASKKLKEEFMFNFYSPAQNREQLEIFGIEDLRFEEIIPRYKMSEKKNIFQKTEWELEGEKCFACGSYSYSKNALCAHSRHLNHLVCVYNKWGYGYVPKLQSEVDRLTKFRDAGFNFEKRQIIIPTYNFIKKRIESAKLASKGTT